MRRDKKKNNEKYSRLHALYLNFIVQKANEQEKYPSTNAPETYTNI